jgi:hypothetical protein
MSVYIYFFVKFSVSGLKCYYLCLMTCLLLMTYLTVLSISIALIGRVIEQVIVKDEEINGVN